MLFAMRLTQHIHLEKFCKPEPLCWCISYQSCCFHKLQEDPIFFLRAGIHSALSSLLWPSQIVMSKRECSSVPHTKKQALLGRIAFIVRKIQRKIRMVWKYLTQSLLVCLP